MSSDSVLCVIPARYGSTRLPAKPLIEVEGVPLVMWTCTAARDSGAFAEIAVATDDTRIADAVTRHGGLAVMTSSDHERGSDRVYEVASSRSHRYVVNLQGDEPEMSPTLLARFVSELCTRVDDNSLLTCVSRVPVDDMDNPNVVKVVLNRRDEALYFSRSPIPFQRERTAPYVKHTGLYGFTTEGLRRFCEFGPGDLERAESLEQLRALENGMTIHCLFHDHPSHGIDTQADLDAFRARVASRTRN